MNDLTVIQKIAVWAIPLIFAITIHEVAHGFVASLCGDKTAKLSGRLSINPIRHVDMVGTILLPFMMLVMQVPFIFGWAKPVPVDARNLHHPRRDLALVALAGPLSNLLMAIAWAGIAKIGIILQPSQPAIGIPLVYMGSAGIMINVVLAVLNFIPIPPLDGSKVLSSLLPPRTAYTFNKLEPFGFLILILLLVMGLLNSIMAPIVFMVINRIAALFGL